ncbi:MAG: hypothetical protein WC151_08595 [Bacteroidales bacterium]
MLRFSHDFAVKKRLPFYEATFTFLMWLFLIVSRIISGFAMLSAGCISSINCEQTIIGFHNGVLLNVKHDEATAVKVA